MTINFKIAEFDFLTAPQAHWDAFFEHIDEIRRETDPEEPIMPREKRQAMSIKAGHSPYMNSHMFLLFPDDAPGAAAGFANVVVETPRSPSFATNSHIGNMHALSISKNYRGLGLGTALLEHVKEVLAVKEPTVTELIAGAVLESGRGFLEAAGATLSLESAENRLALKDVDWAMVERWAAEGGAKNPGAVIKTVPVIPEEDIKEFCEVYSETNNQQPLGDVKIDIRVTPEQIRYMEQQDLEKGLEQTTMYAKESDGRISGLTEIMYFKDLGHRAGQMLTGVRPKYRGRGLGKLLKALMLLHVRAHYPGVKYIVTGNADSNAPMMAINNQLGFKRHLAIKFYKLKLRR